MFFSGFLTSFADRNLQDAMNVTRNILLEGKLLPGGGSVEMAVSARLLANVKSKQVPLFGTTYTWHSDSHGVPHLCLVSMREAR